MVDGDGVESDSGGWRLRPAILAVLGLVAAILVQQLVDPPRPINAIPEPIAVWRIALAIGIGTAALAIGFALERVRLGWTIGFALLAGLVGGFVYYWSGGGPGWGWFEDWRYASLLLSIAIAVPLFQAARDEAAWRFPYRAVHDHAWTNVVLWFACWAFTGIVFLLAWLLASLFDLIGLHFLRELLDRAPVGAGLAGAAYGAGLGLLRERDRVVRLLQRVVTAVLAVLAPVLGAGLLLFLAALPFTGLHALWEATKATTPILLGCVIGVLILANAVIGNSAEEEATNPALRLGAMALGLAALPLCVIAAIATGLRIGQYGFTTDRLWALVFVVLASVYGVAYLVSLVLGRGDWAARVRAANLRIAFVIAGVALFLAMPILSFNAISTRDQVARLESGGIAPGKFDWAALAFDFGDPGKAALKRLSGSKNAVFAALAKEASSKTSRYEITSVVDDVNDADALVKRLRILPAPVPVPLALRKLLTNWDGCGTDAKDACLLLYAPGADEAIAIRTSCLDGMTSEPSTADKMITLVSDSCGEARYRLVAGAWTLAGNGDHPALDAAQRAALKAGLSAGALEVRTVPSRRLYIGGVPVGAPFD